MHITYYICKHTRKKRAAINPTAKTGVAESPHITVTRKKIAPKQTEANGHDDSPKISSESDAIHTEADAHMTLIKTHRPPSQKMRVRLSGLIQKSIMIFLRAY